MGFYRVDRSCPLALSFAVSVDDYADERQSSWIFSFSLQSV